ncbi:MAG: rod-binding protein [bacterium]
MQAAGAALGGADPLTQYSKNARAIRGQDKVDSLKNEFKNTLNSMKKNNLDGKENLQEKIDRRKKKLKKKANKIEGLLFKQLMKQMRKTTFQDEDSMIHGGPGEKTFQKRLDAKYAKKIADNGDFGLAEKIYDQYKHQVVSNLTGNKTR